LVILLIDGVESFASPVLLQVQGLRFLLANRPGVPWILWGCSCEEKSNHWRFLCPKL